jgi:hypothetical protein
LGAPPHRFGFDAAICLAGCWNRWKQAGQSKSRISTSGVCSCFTLASLWQFLGRQFVRWFSLVISARSFWNSLNRAQVVTNSFSFQSRFAIREMAMEFANPRKGEPPDDFSADNSYRETANGGVR